MCAEDYCLDCRIEYHVDKACIEFKAERVNNQDESELIDKLKNEFKLKQCIKCKFWVEKNEGCNHMTCRCKNEFCWLCGALWAPKRECACP